MPLQPGEVSLLTLFADVHYFFSNPDANPPHHRFDKSSYVYLFHNPIQQRGRLEIANHAGTSDQDAFMGYMDNVVVQRSYKHPTLFTITVDGEGGTGGAGSPGPQPELSQWHLPAPDPRNEGKYMFKLHTVDVYFWTVDDSHLFHDSLKRVLRDHQLRILDAPSSPASEHRDTMSPVVRKLEQAAVSKPYRSSRDGSISTTQSAPVAQSATTPPSTVPASSSPAESYKPMAYNPAAPAAPEPIAHREKTPPPPDAASGTGLAAAAVHEHGAQTAGPPATTAPGPYGQQQPQPYVPGPPAQPAPASLPGPPTTASPRQPIQRASTVGSVGSLPLPPQPAPGSAKPPSGQQYAHGFAPPPQSAPTSPYGPAPGSAPPPGPGGLPRQHTMPAQYQQFPQQQYAQQSPVQYGGYQQPPGMPQSGYPPASAYQGQPQAMATHAGYQQYAYGQQPQQYARGQQSQQYAHGQQPQQYAQGQQPQQYAQGQQPQQYAQGQRPQQYAQQANPQQLHAQAYQPTGAETAAHGHGPAKPQGKLEQHTGKLEKGVGRFLKKLDKKF